MNRNILILAALTAVTGVNAQSLIPLDPSLRMAFNTDGLVNTTTGTAVNSTGRGVGFGPTNPAGWFPGSQTVATAQTMWNFMRYNGETFAAGSPFQFGVHAGATAGANVNDFGNLPQSVWVSIYEADVSQAASGTITPGPAVFTNMEIRVRNNAFFPGGAFINFTAVGNLLRPLTNGANYMIAFAPSTAPGSANPTNFIVLGTRPVFQAGSSLATMSEAERLLFRREWLFMNNSANAGGTATFFRAPETGQNMVNPIGYRIYAVPEPMTMTALGLGALALVRRRRK